MKHALILASLALLATSAFAQTKTFNVVGDKLEYRNLATVESVTQFETFTGRTTKIGGAFRFDPKTKTGGGRITVDVASIDTGIPLRNEHMRSGQWLDAEKTPLIIFETTKVQSRGGDNYRVTGKITMRGVTRTVTTNATLKYRAASADTQKAGFTGNVVLLTTNFNLKLSDFGIKISGPAEGKVSNNVTVAVRAYATAL